MDFLIPKIDKVGNNWQLYPSFMISRTKDIMIRANSFYAIWDPEFNRWSTDEYDVQRLVDKELREEFEREKSRFEGLKVKYMRDFSSGSWEKFRKYLKNVSDNYKQLDNKIVFSNEKLKRTDYVSKTLPYALEEGSTEAYDELMSVLYSDDERDKLEWAIGSILSGDSKHIQKFVVLYGGAGSGKSTFLNILERLFEGYTANFEAKALTSNNAQFSMETFRDNPLVAIQHDGDLSRIEDNSRLNSIVSHEYMQMNVKFKSAYTTRINAMLFMGTNKAVKITDAKSGIIRRLIDVTPTGNKVNARKYQKLMAQIDFELGAIAFECLEKYKKMGKEYYNNYIPFKMLFHTDVFFNFMESNYVIFKEQDGVSLQQAYEMYKQYCDESLIAHKMPRHRFREELLVYFDEFLDRYNFEGERIRSYFKGFKTQLFTQQPLNNKENTEVMSLVLDSTDSLFDNVYNNQPAQTATVDDTPRYKWENVRTKLSDINTKEVHFVKLPENHIVIDFDIKNDDNTKSMERNLEEASKWPSTYTEFSKSGAGVHLHYIYDGDPSKLANQYAEDIEIKVFKGNSALRRKVTKCNNRPIAHISSGLPLKKGDSNVINTTSVKSERGLRTLIKRNLAKDIHPGTKPSIDFIKKILDDAYSTGLKYDVSDMYQAVLNFAVQSTNQSDYCVRLVNEMKFKSENPSEDVPHDDDQPIAFFDIEVFINLFLLVYKIKGPENKPVVMLNPTPEDLEELFKLKLVGFNNRRYDNHILYGRYIGYDNEQLYKQSQKIINNAGGTFREAYNLSYTDIYDFSSKKQSLKKFQIELGIKHQEFGLPWDEPVPENKVKLLIDYCTNDVYATEATFDAREQDYAARLILCKLSGLTPNHSTQNHAAKIIFGNDPRPQEKFIYTDLSEMFPGYTYDPTRKPKSLYRGEDPSEGGYVYAVPGIHHNVGLLDVESMHPASAILMNIFGPYTKNFADLRDARLAIKHKDFETAEKMLGGILAPFLTSDEVAKGLSYALKIIINIVYGLTSARFENKFNDPRNKDNIVAKRGALFMIDLKHALIEKGWQTVHIKTDSIKIADITDEKIKFVKEFGKKYGYVFKHEATFEKMFLANDAVYVAKPSWSEDPTEINKWTATGTQFKHPYVFKTMFSGEDVIFADLCETKEVKSALYLDFNEKLPKDEHNYVFVGKVGSFCPIKSGNNAAELMREQNGKYYAATGTKGYRWMESEVVANNKKLLNQVDMLYFNTLVSESIKSINQFGSIEDFLDKDIWFKLKGELENVAA